MNEGLAELLWVGFNLLHRHFLTFSFCSGGQTGFIRLAEVAAGDDGVCCGDDVAFASISMKIERDCLPRPNELMTCFSEKLEQYSFILCFYFSTFDRSIFFSSVCIWPLICGYFFHNFFFFFMNLILIM